MIRSQVMKIVKGLKEGTMLTKAQREELAAKKEAEKEQPFMIWKEGEEEEENTKGPMHIPAPKVP